MVSCTIGSILISDHAHITLIATPFTKAHRAPRWRLNSSLLSEPTFKESLRDKLSQRTNSPSSPSAEFLWEALKAFLRCHITQHASWKKQIAKNRQATLQGKIKEAEGNFKLNMSSANLMLLSRLKYEYNFSESKKAEFALFRAGQKQFEEGDKTSKMLAGYIKIKELACVIPAIRESSILVRGTAENIRQPHNSK